jgi:tRNA pseudouridine38-40 synthase
MRLKCTIAYDGSNFSGYQIQPNKRTVQGELEKALAQMHKGKRVQVYASGRTDASVHAVGQVIHFDSTLSISPDRWKKALNSLLPEDVYVKEIEPVDQSFHARYSATSKEYRYVILTTEEKDVFRRNYAYHFPYALNHEAMKEAAKYLMGTHDFTSFCSAKTEIEDKVRTIYDIDLFMKGNELIFRFVGNGFLYNMVRIMVGTLLEVGQEKLTPIQVKDILLKKDRSYAGKTVPGHGLYLWKVNYDN